MLFPWFGKVHFSGYRLCMSITYFRQLWKVLWYLLAMTDTGTFAMKLVHKRFSNHECPSLRLRRGVCTFWKITIQQNINKLFEIGFRTSEHKHLFNIDKYNVINDCCQHKFTNIQAEIIRIRKTTLIQIRLTNGPKEYEMKFVFVLRSPFLEMVEGTYA